MNERTLLMERITKLEAENAGYRRALALDNQEEPEPDPLRPAVVRYLAAHADYLNAVDLGGDGAVQGDALWRARVALRRVVEGGAS